jgi:hypothetical protein
MAGAQAACSLGIVACLAHRALSQRGTGDRAANYKLLAAPRPGGPLQSGAPPPALSPDQERAPDTIRLGRHS